MAELFERLRFLIYAVLAAPLLAGLAYLAFERLDEDPAPLLIEDGAGADIRVYVAGAVREPGVYPVAEGSRWIDALDAAGGALPEADLAAVNLARRVQDEDHVVVPFADGRAVLAEQSGPLINLNAADQGLLESLPGIGEVRATRIIESRTEDGPFTQVEDLLLRDLIPSSVYEEILPLVTVE